MSVTVKGSIARHFVLAMFVTVLVSETVFGQLTSFEEPPIDYMNAEVNDAVTRLSAQLESGETRLEHDAHGYLTSVLRAMDIAVSSQILVFSKTSMQMQRISPSRDP